MQAPAGCASPAIEGDDLTLFGGRCARIGGRLCDAEVGKTMGGKVITCDAPMCEQHRMSAGDDVDYCPKHAQGEGRERGTQ